VLDIVEERSNNSTVYIIGKIYQPTAKKFCSCCLIVTKIDKCLYFYPKKKDNGSLTTCDEIKTEFDKIRNKLGISKYIAKKVKKNYAFELDIPHVPMEVLKVKYLANMPSP